MTGMPEAVLARSWAFPMRPSTSSPTMRQAGPTVATASASRRSRACCTRRCSAFGWSSSGSPGATPRSARRPTEGRSHRSDLELFEQLALQADPAGTLREAAAADEEGVLDSFAQRRDLGCVKRRAVFYERRRDRVKQAGAICGHDREGRTAPLVVAFDAHRRRDREMLQAPRQAGAARTSGGRSCSRRSVSSCSMKGIISRSLLRSLTSSSTKLSSA